MTLSKFLLVCSSIAALSGCLKIDPLIKTMEQPLSDTPAPPPEDKLSTWHYDSLSLCHTSIDEITQYQPPESVNIWDKVREGFALPEETHHRILENVTWYSRHPKYMERVTKRSRRYLYHIVGELEKRNLPMELALLPIVESAYDPFAYSHGRASGMWQIIPGTGKMLGLKQTWWYDGRRDVVASTDAALNYLESLLKRFDGDWLHALAAYNSGAGNVNKAIRRNKKKGRPTDFWSLKLPKETEGYVPRLLALKELVIRPDIHNLSLFPVENRPYFESVDVGSQIDLAQAAELAEIDMDEFYQLNPGFNRWATDPKGPHNLLVPIENAESFKEKLASIPSEERVTWDRYKIRSGDSLSTIAVKFNTTMDLLKSVNNIRGTNIRAGKTLLVPTASADLKHYSKSLNERLKKKQARGKGHRIEYIVKEGDSFWTISQRYKVSHKKLAKWNGMAPKDPIRVGQKLVIWQKTANSKAKPSSGVVRKIHYKVRKGDSLARIASKFNIKTKNILAWNSVNPDKYLQPGQSLTLFVDVTKAP